jgi:hypothetical protein
MFANPKNSLIYNRNSKYSSLFFAFLLKKIVQAVMLYICLLYFSFCVTVPEDEYTPDDLQEEELEPRK